MKKKPVLRSKIRKADLDDARGIYELINRYAKKKGDFLLPRSLTSIYENIRDYIVCVTPKKKVIGCGALHVVWEGLAELKSLAVSRHYHGRGIGTRMVEALLEEAVIMKLEKVFTLTIKPDFFVKIGFRVVDKMELPHKVWGECVNCCFFPDCEEVPLSIEL
jgi:amino-acid N-acetyltransferase